MSDTVALGVADVERVSVVVTVPEAVAAGTDIVVSADTVGESVKDTVGEKESDGDEEMEGDSLATVAVTDKLLSDDGETLKEGLPLGVIDTLATNVVVD